MYKAGPYAFSYGLKVKEETRGCTKLPEALKCGVVF